MTDEVTARATCNIREVAAGLHENGMSESEVVKFIGEAAYDYFDELAVMRIIASLDSTEDHQEKE